MYNKLIINDFRQFKNEEIEIGKFLTVLAGRNSTGKSTILGLLANSGELKKKDGVAYGNRQFRAEFSEILKGSKQFDISGSKRFVIDIVNDRGECIDYREFRTSWQTTKNGENRFRVIPFKKTGEKTKTESKMAIPVIYLGLSRLFPIGEAETEKIRAKSVSFESDAQREWFVEHYKRILSMYTNINVIDNFSIGETTKKRGVGVGTNEYNYLTNSAGQDNLGQILLAMLSFKNLKEKRKDVWNGGLLLIDEIDATLHPAAQRKLMELCIKEARENDYQIVVTTHSTDLLESVYKKTKHNGENKNNIELYYFTNANRMLDIRRNPTFTSIKNDLKIESIIQSNCQIKVYSEDDENRWFAKKLLNAYVPYIKFLDVNIGCDELISMYNADPEYFGNTLIILDGDVKDSQLNRIPKTTREKMSNIIRLPGDNRPEMVLYDYIKSLNPEHCYWDEAGKYDLSWTYFSEHGPDSYEQEKKREKAKAWFNDYKQLFEQTKLLDCWANDNVALVEQFKEKFINSYNRVAQRMFVPLIESGNTNK